MAKTETEIEIKRIEAGGDNNRFSDLFLKCFRQKKDESYFRWKYFDNPAGPIIGYEAIVKGKVIASYGVIPEYYTINGEKRIIYQAVDAMVSPRFWGKRLFEQIAQKTQEDIVNKDNQTLLINFPGRLAYKEFVKNLGWQIVQEKCKYIFVLRQYFQITNPFLFLSKVTICKFTKIEKELEDYLKLSTPQTFISKFFDADVFQWKIFENPNYKYSVLGIKDNDDLLGICIFRRDTEKTCEISYINFLDSNNYRKYLPFFIKYILTENTVRYVYTWKPSNGILANAYKSSGLSINPFSRGPFRETFPFLIYEKNQLLAKQIASYDNYEIQPILLD